MKRRYSPFATAQGATPLTFDSGTEIVRCSARLPATTVESAPEALLLDLAVYEAGLRAEAGGV